MFHRCRSLLLHLMGDVAFVLSVTRLLAAWE